MARRTDYPDSSRSRWTRTDYQCSSEGPHLHSSSRPAHPAPSSGGQGRRRDHQIDFLLLFQLPCRQLGAALSESLFVQRWVSYVRLNAPSRELRLDRKCSALLSRSCLRMMREDSETFFFTFMCVLWKASKFLLLLHVCTALWWILWNLCMFTRTSFICWTAWLISVVMMPDRAVICDMFPVCNN